MLPFSTRATPAENREITQHVRLVFAEGVNLPLSLPTKEDECFFQVDADIDAEVSDTGALANSELIWSENRWQDTVELLKPPVTHRLRYYEVLFHSLISSNAP